MYVANLINYNELHLHFSFFLIQKMSLVQLPPLPLLKLYDLFLKRNKQKSGKIKLYFVYSRINFVVADMANVYDVITFDFFSVP